MLRLRNNTAATVSIVVIISICFWINQSDGDNFEDAELFKMLDEGIPIKQDDQTLVNHVASIIEYPVKGAQLNLVNDVKTQKGQANQVDVLLDLLDEDEVEGGFFIEAGAHDGEYLSNTLYLEVVHGWTGLLVEANNITYSALRKKNRNALSINNCLSMTRYPEKVEFDAADVLGGIKHIEGEEHLIRGRDLYITGPDRQNHTYQCYPFYTILLAIGNPRITLLSLDIEGAEEAVLATIPWDRVDIDIVLLETRHSDSTAIEKMMTGAGYRVVTTVGDDTVFRQVKHTAAQMEENKLF